jgi:hypothetical protein
MNQLVPFFLQPSESRRSAPRRPLFAALSAGGAGAAVAPKLLREPRTGLDFPPEFCSRGRKGCAQLEGVGVRAKRIAGLKVNVYALGIYFDEAAAKKALGPKHKGKPAAVLAKDAALFAGARTLQQACMAASLHGAAAAARQRSGTQIGAGGERRGWADACQRSLSRRR